jgi:hypothetical protein
MPYPPLHLMAACGAAGADAKALYARVARMDLAQNVFRNGQWGRHLCAPTLLPRVCSPGSVYLCSPGGVQLRAVPVGMQHAGIVAAPRRQPSKPRMFAQQPCT